MFLFLFYFFLCYLLYRLIFNLILPIYRATKQVKSTFREMNEQMRESAAPQSPKPENRKPGKGPVGEYIDFEEVP
jgi:hypothetical protein